MKVLPVILIMVLTVSLIEAFLILPHHLSHSVHNDEDARSSLRMRFDAGIDWVRDRWVGRAVDWALTWRYLFMGGVFSLLLLSVAMLAGGQLKFRAFPDLEGNVMQARILLPQGTPLVSTTMGCEGIDVVPGQHVLFADTPAEFVQQIVRLCGDPELFSSLARNGRRFVEQRYSWNVIGERLRAAYASLFRE